MATFIMPSVLSDSEINTLISQVCTNARNGQGDLQKAIIQATLSLKVNGNGNPLARIMNELPNSSRVKSIMAYVKEFAPVKFKQGKDVHGNPMTQQDGRPRVNVALIKKSVESDWRLEEMMQTTFYDWARPKVEKEIEYSIADTLKRFVKKIDKALQEAIEPVKADQLRTEKNRAEAIMLQLGIATN